MSRLSKIIVYSQHVVTSGHVTKMAVTPIRKHHVHANFYILQNGLQIEVLHCGNVDFRPVSLLLDYLDLDPMTFIYEPDPCSLELYWMCKYELSTSKLSIFIV